MHSGIGIDHVGIWRDVQAHKPSLDGEGDGLFARPCSQFATRIAQVEGNRRQRDLQLLGNAVIREAARKCFQALQLALRERARICFNVDAGH
jgi:hypothetical protein